MSKVRILKRNGKSYLELPPEAAGYGELELFHLREGYYLISLPLGEMPQGKGLLDDSEKMLLKKLLSIRFEKRTPPYVSKAFSEGEMAKLKELERRKLVNVFRSKKYADGVYNISDKVYTLLHQKKEQPSEPKEDETTPLKSQGFQILTDKNQAYRLSQSLSQEMREGTVFGVKGFDNKFYIVTREYLDRAQSAISDVLKGDMEPVTIASLARLDNDGCIAVLRLMAEKGDIIEKKKGVFAPV